jgi:hypothetical protein
MYWHCRKRDTNQGQAVCLAFFVDARPSSFPRRERTMIETYSKSRQQAEIAFGRTQTELFAKGQAADALDTIARARDEKTRRLREARKAKEFADEMTAKITTARKRSKHA